MPFGPNKKRATAFLSRTLRPVQIIYLRQHTFDFSSLPSTQTRPRIPALLLPLLTTPLLLLLLLCRIPPRTTRISLPILRIIRVLSRWRPRRRRRRDIALRQSGLRSGATLIATILLWLLMLMRRLPPGLLLVMRVRRWREVLLVRRGGDRPVICRVVRGLGIAGLMVGGVLLLGLGLVRFAARRVLLLLVESV